MSTSRVFEAQYIYEQCVIALESLERCIDIDWRRKCEEDYYPRHVAMVEEDNECIFRKLFRKPKKEPMPFEEYVEWRKEFSDDWGYSSYRSHKERPYLVDAASLRRIRNLAKECASASNEITVESCDYRDICYYVRRKDEK